MSYERGEEEEPEEGDEEGEELPQQVAELAQAPVPNALRGIRACKRCGLLKTLDQFINEGCENCPFLDMVRAKERKFNVVLLTFQDLLECLDTVAAQKSSTRIEDMHVMCKYVNFLKDAHMHAIPDPI